MAWISKTDYVLWRECAKNAWLKLHRPEVYYDAELTEFDQAVIDAGIEVEGVARGLFLGGVLVTGSKAPQPPNGESARAIRSDNGVPFASPNGLFIVKERVRNVAICVN
jgi:hypothetical protein